MKRLFRISISMLAALCCALPAFPCTTFVLQDGDRVYFGRNLDWDWEDGLVMINPRNLQKRAFVMSSNAAQWTSKYGSVTFNQFGREMPFGGMNEAGLVVENMWLSETEYPGPDDRPEINMLQWIQYQLDKFETLDQVRQGSYTAWQMVYDVSRRQIHFRTRSSPETRKVDLTKLDFACRLPNQFVDIRAKPSASGALEFKPLLEADHRAYLERFFTQPSLRQTVGEITPMIEPLLQTVQGYGCAGSEGVIE